MDELTMEQVIDGFRCSPLSMRERGRALAAYLNSVAKKQNDKGLHNGRMIRCSIDLSRIDGSMAYMAHITMVDRLDEAGFHCQSQDFHEFAIDLSPLVRAD